jgi:hypothetical protein
VSGPPEPPIADPFGGIPDPLAGAETPAPALRLPDLEPSPDRSVVKQRRLAALVGSLCWLAAHLAVFGVRKDLDQLPVAYAAAQVLLPFAFAVLSLFIALGSGRLGLGLKVSLISALAFLGPASFVLVAIGAPVPVGEGPEGLASLVRIFVCFDLTVAWAAVPLLLAALTLRGAFASSARWRSALVGAGAGLFAGATMNLHCPNVAPVHMLLGHGMPVIIATLAGALLLALRARA